MYTNSNTQLTKMGPRRSALKRLNSYKKNKSVKVMFNNIMINPIQKTVITNYI